MIYTQKIMQHFLNPQNVGEISDADGVGEVGNPSCGDMMIIYLKIKDNLITDIKFKTFGCAAAIATSSIITTMVHGMTLENAVNISRSDIAKELGGLPPHKMHCSNLAASALKLAIENYYRKGQGLPPRVQLNVDDEYSLLEEGSCFSENKPA